ncbi:MAG: hypothetical protein E7666_00265 [Ruminococcaceae bacterium]|nr:hypothetical protein [Oscillospiraceae bacterium]
MQAVKKERVRTLLSILLLVALLSTLILQMMLSPSGNDCFFSGDAETYYQSLLDAGFPEDYATALTELHLLHPTWEFKPLLVSELEPTHTWKYVLDRETADADLNLISKSDPYSAYWHEWNRDEPETGYFQPSRAAVAYFMDPRNFLNEADIFQFFDLSAGTDASIATVQAVLNGTFMESAKLENGKGYAAYFCEIGNALGINPVFLAAKVRQEQGVAGTSPLISGTCGTTLRNFYVHQTEYTDSGKAVLPPSSGHTSEELLALNGLYNYYNIKASGAGVFAIYYNALTYAQKGSSSKADEWGNSGAWNTRWKALWGGAEFLKNNYIDVYQPTIYLQKYNVDARSAGVFKKQYMASIPGALSEGRILYQSFAATDILDSACSFLIPVYKDMPTEISKDPAGATCSSTAIATTKYQFSGELKKPSRQRAENGAIYLNYETYQTASLSMEGVFTHSYGVKGLEYNWDGGEWTSVSDGKSLDATIPSNFEEGSTHILVIRQQTAYGSDASRKHCAYALAAVIYVKTIPAPTVTLTYQVANTTTTEQIRAGSEITLPITESNDFAGWLGSDGSFLPSGASYTVMSDRTFSAIFLDYDAIAGAALSLNPQNTHLRFSCLIRESTYKDLTERSLLQVQAKWKTEQDEGALTTVSSPKRQPDGRLRVDIETPTLSPADWNTPYSADFVFRISYTNETNRTLTYSIPVLRTAAQVASTALSCTSDNYSVNEIAVLQAIADTY